MLRHSRVLLLPLFGILATILSAQAPARKAVYATYSDVHAILEALSDIVPSDLQSSADPSAAWAKWVVRRDQEIRGRLLQGEEDSAVNLLLFGTSFTRQARLEPAALAGPSGEKGDTAGAISERAAELIRQRTNDFVAALVRPGSNERLQFVRGMLGNQGYRLETEQDLLHVREHLAANLKRVLQEQITYQRELKAAQQLDDPSEKFAKRSTLFRTRGLSLDTSLLPDFALEESLRAMRDRGLLERGSVHRVAVIGPGLDFADKNAGYDFYPQQTVQPFAIIDTLLRLGLARRENLSVTTLDISAQVNDHLARARERARRGLGYTVQLPLDSGVDWKPEVLRYWQRFGDQIGVPAAGAAAPSTAGAVKVRAVRIRPGVTLEVEPMDLNIVLQRVVAEPGEGFDLIVATNMFIYYDVFEQSLALANVGHMLRPGGFLLSNNALLELPVSRMQSVDYLTTVYSDRPDDGDHIVWYQRAKD
jgi:hypothetical protein